MRRLIALILFAIIALLIITRLFSTTEKVEEMEKPVVKIGAIIPLTGDFANIGNSFKNAILLAQKDINKRDLKNRYEFIIDDDSFETKKTVSLFQKQKSVDNVDAMTSFASSTGNVIAPLTEQAKIIYINVGASDKKNIAERSKYNFIHWTMPTETSQRIIDFYKSKNYKRIAFVGEIDAGVQSIEQTFTSKAQAQGLETQAFYFQKGAKDFRALLSKVKAYEPDAYLTMVWGGAIVPFMKQFKEAGIDKTVGNIEVFSMVDDFSIIEGAYFTDVAQSKDDFVKRLKAEFPDTSSEFAVGNVYDVIMLMVEAFENAKTKDQAVDELIKIKEYDGIVGKLIQDDSGVFNSNAVLKKVENGKPILVEE